MPPKRHTTLAFFWAYLVIQIALPLLGILRSDPRFRWNMFSGRTASPAITLIHTNEAKEPLATFQRRTGHGRTHRDEIDFLRFAPPYFCSLSRSIASIQAIEIEDPRTGNTTRHVCRP